MFYFKMFDFIDFIYFKKVYIYNLFYVLHNLVKRKHDKDTIILKYKS